MNTNTKNFNKKTLGFEQKKTKISRELKNFAISQNRWMIKKKKK